MLLLSITALVLSVAPTLIDATAINCYSGTVCSVGAGSGIASLKLSTKRSDNGVCTSVAYDCRSTNAIHVNDLCKTCPGGFLTQFSTPQTAQEIASLKAQAKSFSPAAKFSTCATPFCNAPAASNFVPITTPNDKFPICYTGRTCVNSVSSGADLVATVRTEGRDSSCYNSAFDCTKSTSPECQKCPGGVVNSFGLFAGSIAASELGRSVRMYNGTNKSCDGKDYCNQPTFSSAVPSPTDKVADDSKKDTGSSSKSNPSSGGGSDAVIKPSGTQLSSTQPSSPTNTPAANAVTSTTAPVLMAMLMGTGLVVVALA